MEDASAVDLDWFWRGWFYTTDHCDLAIDGVRLYTLDTRDPEIEKGRRRAEREDEPESLTDVRNAGMPRRAEAFPDLKDFYNEYDELDVTEKDRKAFADLVGKLEEDEKELLALGSNFYVIDVQNEGGLPMPVILQLHFEDGSVDELRVPAEIWRSNGTAVSKLIRTQKTLARVVMDPHLETADIDLADNRFPREVMPERVEIKNRDRDRPNPMREAQEPASKPVEAGTTPGEADATAGDSSD